MSIRLKLGILYLVFFLVTIIGFGAGLMKLLVDHVETEIDRTLQSRTRTIVRIAESGMTTETTARDIGKLLRPQTADLRESDVYLQVLDPTGRWVASSINLHGQRLPVTSDALKAQSSRQNISEITQSQAARTRTQHDSMHPDIPHHDRLGNISVNCV